MTESGDVPDLDEDLCATVRAAGAGATWGGAGNGRSWLR
ncbi:hypothetical protein GA0115240_128516 [Streptomyces sp. DvalAA-14]|nr:hypothetical protein GA0115240_128516 [Streptomyces sp. DvalAA-14]